ncbi:MAG: serine/threonine protein kinase [Myxococcales bacterium]|nr:serine/threonine protein kinase [Myxococcales bacterium]
MPPQPGARITDFLELISPLGEGAMGKVWVAFHHRLQIRVAVKFVSERVSRDDAAEAIARFEHEASLASQIKSPHVVQTFDSGIGRDGTPYIVMELLEGQSLGERVRSSGPLGCHEAATVITQVARALTKAHELGIVHRDIKPDNIFLCRSDEGLSCKVLDFGVAKQTRLPAMGGLTTDGKLVGTPEYISPELVLEDRPADYRADLWALAVVMYATLTGALPYSGKTLGQLCMNLVNSPFIPPRQLRGELPELTDAWFARALAIDPGKRFGSAREMAVAFAELTTGGSSLMTATLLGGSRATDPTTLVQFGTAQDALAASPNARLSRRVKAAASAALVLAVCTSLYVLASTPRPSPKNEAPPASGARAAAGSEHVVASPMDTKLAKPPAAVSATAAATEQPSAGAIPSAASSLSARVAAPRASGFESAAKAAPTPDAPPISGRRGKDELGF